MLNIATVAGRFDPVHSAHSIEQAAVVVQFDRPIEQIALSNAQALSERFKVDLPGGGPIQSFTVAFGGPAGALPHQPVPAAAMGAGAVLLRAAPDGSVERELRIEPSSLSFRTTRYSRWSDFWGEASKYFSALVRTYTEAGASVTGIGVNFVDKFVWNGVAKEFDLAMLLRRGSHYLPDYIFSQTDLWHHHTGAFLRIDDTTKRLLNLNIDCLDEAVGGEMRRAILVTTVLTDMFNQPGYAVSEIAGTSAIDVISDHMAALHDFDKDILSKILVDSMAKQIDLIG